MTEEEEAEEEAEEEEKKKKMISEMSLRPSSPWAITLA
jgi:hypothetical protein